MTDASIAEAATADAQDLVTDLRNPALAPPFDTLNKSHFQALFHLSDIFKQETDPGPITLTIPIPIPAVTPLRVPQYDPPRVPVYLFPSLIPLIALLRVLGSHLASTKISPLKFHFSPLPPRHNNP